MTRVILDEGVPRSLARHLRDIGIDAAPFPNGMKQLSNGRLLAEIERQGFDVLLTNDKQMRFQQNLTGKSVAIVSLPTNIKAAAKPASIGSTPDSGLDRKRRISTRLVLPVIP